MIHRFQRLITLLCILVFTFLICNIWSCKSYVYTFKAFSYPPGSKPHEDNWQYLGKILIISREEGPLSKKSNKTLKIFVVDQKERSFLSDEFKIVCGSTEAIVLWETFEKIEIYLYEVGNKFVNDDFNKKLIEKGSILLLHLKYVFDNSEKKFKIQNL